jgi:hypothetical protein
MSISADNKSLAARAAAILTTGEVAATELNLNKCRFGTVCVETLFTVGSLDSADVRYYVSMDNVTYYPIETAGGDVSHNLTVNTNKIVTITAPGYRWFRSSIQGTGTVTSSTATTTYRYLQD